MWRVCLEKLQRLSTEFGDTLLRGVDRITARSNSRYVTIIVLIMTNG